MKEFASINISQNQLTILKILYSHGPLPAHEIAQKIGISRAAVSQSIDVLVKATYVSRKQSRSDRRSVTISILKAGTTLLMQYNDILRNQQLSAILGLSLEEQIQFNHLLDKYIATLVNKEQNLDIICLGCHESLEYDCIIKKIQGHCILNKPEVESSNI